jgi:hypothetical protein
MDWNEKMLPPFSGPFSLSGGGASWPSPAALAAATAAEAAALNIFEHLF